MIDDFYQTDRKRLIAARQLAIAEWIEQSQPQLSLNEILYILLVEARALSECLVHDDEQTNYLEFLVERVKNKNQGE